jgi:hypothetical protein
MLGCVAAVIAMVSPSQPSPAVIQSRWISFMGTDAEPGTKLCWGELGMRFPLWNPNFPYCVLRYSRKTLLTEALRGDCTESSGGCVVFFSLGAGRRVRRERTSLMSVPSLNPCLRVCACSAANDSLTTYDPAPAPYVARIFRVVGKSRNILMNPIITKGATTLRIVIFTTVHLMDLSLPT